MGMLFQVSRHRRLPRLHRVGKPTRFGQLGVLHEDLVPERGESACLPRHRLRSHGLRAARSTEPATAEPAAVATAEPTSSKPTYSITAAIATAIAAASKAASTRDATTWALPATTTEPDNAAAWEAAAAAVAQSAGRVRWLHVSGSVCIVGGRAQRDQLDAEWLYDRHWLFKARSGWRDARGHGSKRLEHTALRRPHGRADAQGWAKTGMDAIVGLSSVCDYGCTR